MSERMNSTVTNDIGTAESVLYEATEKSMVISCILTNYTGATLPIALILRREAADTYLSRATRVKGGEPRDILNGARFVMLPGDQLLAQAPLDDSFDAVTSMIEGVL